MSSINEDAVFDAITAGPGPYCLWLPALISPNTGKPVQASASHALDCAWALAAERNGRTLRPYLRVPVRNVPADVERCRRCGGGR